MAESIPSERLFPSLTPEQVQRAASHERIRMGNRGEVLVERGSANTRFFTVRTGQLEIVWPDPGELVITPLDSGQFTGETSMLAGRPALVRIRVSESGELIEIEREQLMPLVQTDSELSDILMCAFILRRVELIARGFGDVVLLGSTHSPDTLRIKEFLTRNNHPYSYIDLDKDHTVQAVLDRFHVSIDDVPVAICRNDVVLRNPSNEKIADCLGLNEAIDPMHMRDVVIVGAGLRARGSRLRRLRRIGRAGRGVERAWPGRIQLQDRKLSRLSHRYLRPGSRRTCILAGSKIRGAGHDREKGQRALVQSYTVRCCNGRRIAYPHALDRHCDSAQYRRPQLENLGQFEGNGVYYGATFVEAQLCRGEDVIVIGGGDSAGQAAVFLSKAANHVYPLVRSSGLAESISRYLVRRIEETPPITLLTNKEITELDGARQLERVRWRNNKTGKDETHDIRHVFVMAGALPNTAWLHGCVVLDGDGFIKTGPDLSPDDLAAAHWPLARPPYLLETSLPGVFAVGDVRAGNVKRVASAVGEGSIAISFVHQLVHE
jgi:thioredoxin reductase (NADPH)